MKYEFSVDDLRLILELISQVLTAVNNQQLESSRDLSDIRALGDKIEGMLNAKHE